MADEEKLRREVDAAYTAVCIPNSSEATVVVDLLKREAALDALRDHYQARTFDGDERDLREYLARLGKVGADALALLDAKDEELSGERAAKEWLILKREEAEAERDAKDAEKRDALLDANEQLATVRRQRDEALSRAEQAETRVAELTTALAKQTEQQDYPCSPHCAGYLREQDALAKLEQAEAALAEERKAHQVFREEVSEACHNARYYAGDGKFLNIPEVKRILERFILPAPEPVDPLVEAIKALQDGRAGPTPESYAACLRNEVEARGGKVVFGEVGK